MKTSILIGFLSTYLIFIIVLYFILNLKFSISPLGVTFIGIILLVLGDLIKRWLK